MFKLFLKQANSNLINLKENTYPGRGIVIGLSKDERYFVQVYWIMGRSKNSRNRIFILENNGNMRTAPANFTKEDDLSLTIYRAMAEYRGVYVVSNGNQTNNIIEALRNDSNISDCFHEALVACQYEPDFPNFTSRISAICYKQSNSPVAEISLLRKSAFNSGCNRFFYRYDNFCPGTGYCITTYLHDGNPLPPFNGEPYPLLLSGKDMDSIVNSIWRHLNKDNRISLSVKFIDLKQKNRSIIKVKNKYQAV